MQTPCRNLELSCLSLASKPRSGMKHTILIRAVDQAGNVETKPKQIKVLVIRKR